MRVSVRSARWLLAGGFCLYACATTAFAQAAKSDAAGCEDSKILPKMVGCRIDNCESKEFERKDVAVGREANGNPMVETMEGELRSVMYECGETVTAAQIVQHGAAILRANGYTVPYVATDAEAEMSARKDNLWVLVEAIAKYYTLHEFKTIPREPEPLDAVELGEAITKNGHVAVYGIAFDPARAQVSSDSDSIVDDVAAMMKAHPDWKFRVEVHTDNLGSPASNLSFSRQRALALVNALVSRGVERLRISPLGAGDAQPIAPNNTTDGRMLNRRVEIVRLVVK